MRLIVLGAPGSGRRTLLRRIAETFGLALVGTGRGPERPADAPPPATLPDALEREIREQAAAGFLLDWIPGSREQAQALDTLLATLGHSLDLVLQIEIDSDELLERQTGRLTCRDCGKVYNRFTSPPRVDEACDDCGGTLRESSREGNKVLANRLRHYNAVATPLAAYYGKTAVLRRIRGEADDDDLFAAARRVIDGIAAAAAPPAPFPPERETPPLPEAAPAEVDTEETPAPDTDGQKSDTDDATPAGGGWKRTAERRGRIKRRSAGT